MTIEGGTGDAEQADARRVERLDVRFAALHDALRDIARQILRTRSAAVAMRPTELLNESYVRLASRGVEPPERRTEFLAFAATVIRNVLVDRARELAALKRGGAYERVTLHGDPLEAQGGSLDPVDVLELERALAELGSRDPRQMRVVEMKFFAGLTIDEIAEQLGMSPRLVDADWAHARAWLHRALS